jgi:transcription initiation protein SPT3
MSTAFTMKGPSHELYSGVHNLLASASATTNPDDSETPEEFTERLTYSIEQMMFVSGETAEASPETTGMIEEIVRAQVIEMVSLFYFASVAALPWMKAPQVLLPWLYLSKFSRGPSPCLLTSQLKQATELANRRGVRSISTADLIFLIRHDKAKVSRLKTFLSWKDVRKNVKDSDEKGGGDAGEVDFDDVCYQRPSTANTYHR